MLASGAAYADNTGGWRYAGTAVLEAAPAAPVRSGMGGAYAAVASGADSVLREIPAGMDQLPRPAAANIGHLAYLDGVGDDYLEVARPIYGLGAWGFGANYLYTLTQDQGYDNFGHADLHLQQL